MSFDSDMLAPSPRSDGSYARARSTGVFPRHLQRDMPVPIRAIREVTHQTAEASACARVLIVFVLHAADTIGDDQSSKLLRKRQGIIGRDKSSARGAYQMKSINAQKLYQRMKVVRCRAGLRTRLCHGAAPTAPVIRDETVARSSEHRNLVFPVLAASCVGVQEHDRHAGAPRVLVPKPDVREFRVRLAPLRKRQSR